MMSAIKSLKHLKQPHTFRSYGILPTSELEGNKPKSPAAGGSSPAETR